MWLSAVLCGAVPGGLKGRGPLALVQSPERPLSARAVPRARICRSATASGARAFVAQGHLQLRCRLWLL